MRGRKEEEVAKVDKLIDYVQFCGAGAHDKDEPLRLLHNEEDRISVHQLSDILKEGKSVVVDVRSKPEMQICSLPNTMNIPIGDVEKSDALDLLKKKMTESQSNSLYVLCRRGNDSQKAVISFRKHFENVKDVRGGLHAWAAKIDNEFPVY